MPTSAADRRDTFFFATTLGAAIAALTLALLPRDLWETLFSRGDGLSAPQLAQMFQPMMAILGGAFFVIALLFHVSGKRIDKTLERLSVSDAPTSRKEYLFWTLLVCVLVLVFDGQSLSSGYFEADDFDLVSLDREHSLSTLTKTTHNDHVMFLLRVQIRATRSLFGARPWGYNILILCSFSALLTAGTWFLRDCRVSRMASAVFLLLCISWTAWGQLTTGCYVLQKYMQIMISTAFALWCWRRWTLSGKQIWLGGITFCLAFACWMNISGFWSPLALLAFSFCDVVSRSAMRETIIRLRSQWYWVIAIIMAVISAAVFTAWVFQLPGNNVFLSSADDSDRSPGGILIQVARYLGTVVLSAGIPFPHHLEQFGLLEPALLLAVVGYLVVTGFTLLRLDRPASGQVVGLCVVLGGLAGMICLGRPSVELAQIWPAKFTGTGWFWLCLTTTCILNSFMMVPDRKQFRRIVITGLTCIVWVQYVGDCLCGAGVPFFRYDVSRQGLLHEHKRERAALEDLRARLIEPIATPDEPLFIPDLSGGQISQVYPDLAYPWGITPDLWTFSAVLLDGLPAESRIVKPDSTRISPAFRQLVQQDTFVGQLYSSPWQHSMPATDTPDSRARPEDSIRRSD